MACVVTFVFTNPRHHLEMMEPVARELKGRGVKARFVSLAELRGFVTPDLLSGITIEHAIPRWIRRNPSTGSKIGVGTGHGAALRDAARAAVWALLGPRLRWLLRGSDLVVIPNDTAYPYDVLARSLRRRQVPFALLQEGIRFPLPNEQRAGTPYGGNGAHAICVWGEASAEHFRTVAGKDRVIVTGTPRWDGVDPTAWQSRGEALQQRLGLTRQPLLYLSNTVDDQGFCTTAEKMQLFERFMDRALPILAREQRALVVKLHPREDLDAFRLAAARRPDGSVQVLGSESLFEVLAMGAAAVVLASTVGLEAMAFGIPVGVLALPRYGHVFEYVAKQAAIGLTFDNLDNELPTLLATPGASPRTAEFLERHMANRGHAAARIATTLVDLQAGRLS